MIENLIDIKDFRITFAAARVNSKLTQDDVCKILKISKATLVKIEKYEKGISTDMLEKFKEIYKVPDKDLFFLKEKNN